MFYHKTMILEGQELLALVVHNYPAWLDITVELDRPFCNLSR